MNPIDDPSCPALPLVLAEAVLVAAIRSIRYIRRSDAAKHAPYLNVALRSIIPEVTEAAVASQAFADMDGASACGNTDLLPLMIRMSQSPRYSKSLLLNYTKAAVDSASERGHIDVLNWWVAHRDLLPFKHSFLAMHRASEMGRVDVLDWWMKSDLPLRYSDRAVFAAVKAGHVHVLDWWLQYGRFTTFQPKFLDDVGVFGHVEVLEWWHAHRYRVSAQWTRQPYSLKLATAALENGHVHVLDWLMKSGFSVRFDERGTDAMYGAIRRGKHKSLEWLAKNPNVGIPIDNLGIEYAMLEGKDATYWQWLLDAGVSQVSFKLFLRAFEHPNLEYIDWCDRQLRPSAQRVTDAHLLRMFSDACSAGSVELLDWIANHPRFGRAASTLQGKELEPIATHDGMYQEWDLHGGLGEMEIDYGHHVVEQCFEFAAEKGHVNVMDWLVANGVLLDMETAERCSFAASRNGRPQVLEWIAHHFECLGIAQWPWNLSLHLATALDGFGFQPDGDYVGVLEWFWIHHSPLFGPFNDWQGITGFTRSEDLLSWWTRVAEPALPVQHRFSTSLDTIRHAGLLDWWLKSGRTDSRYTAAAMDNASAHGKVDLLECWQRFALSHDDGLSTLKYTEAAMNDASRNGLLEILEWWESSGIVPLKYSEDALVFVPGVNEERQIEIRRWWLLRGLRLLF